MILPKLLSGVSNIIFERQISKKMDELFEKREYKKILESISSFQTAFSDSEIDRKSFQDFLMKSDIRFSIYQFIYERYSVNSISERKLFIDVLVTKAMSDMNYNNAKFSRPIFTNEKLLIQYFVDLLDSLYETMLSKLSRESKSELSVISELIEKKFSYNYLNKETQLTSEFLTYSLTRSIDNLGGRYTPDFNVETQNKWALECLGKSDDFLLEINRLRMRVLINYSDLYYFLKENKSFNSISSLSECLSKEFLTTINNEISFSTNFIELIETLQKLKLPETYWIEELTHEQRSRLRYYIDPVENSLSVFIDFLDNAKLNVINSPYLLVTGKAGIGKSHMLADYSKKFAERGHSTFLVLGSYFYNSEDPANQMMKSLRIPNSSFKSILDQLDRKGTETGNRSIIFIDALNEGSGLTFWKNKLTGFIKEIQEYPNIGIVLSVRSDYEDRILPDDFKHLNFSELEHIGLEGTINDSIKAFCKYYKLKYPTIPSFNEEFNNPLFLKMVCELLVDSNVNQFNSNFSIETVMRHYLTRIEKVLSTKERMNFDPNRRILNELVLAISELKFGTEWRLLEYNKVYDKLTSVGKKLAIEKPGSLLQELITEGLLNIVQVGDDEIFLDFQYEKFSDFFVADYIYQNYIVSKNIDNLEDIAELTSYFKNEDALRNHYGILIMLSTIIANQKNKEIFSYLPTLGTRYLIFELIFESLPYRNSNAISSKFIDFIETEISKIEILMRYFVTSQFQLSTSNTSPINSRWLHSFLSEKTQQEIDQIWTMNISKYYRSFISQFTKWYREFNVFTSKEETELVLLQLGWILSSTNRYFRDQATLAIVGILKTNSDLIPFFVNSFVNVNDRYVVERAMGAIYGATINLTDNTKINEISKAIYDSFFDVEKVVPNVLARDYGRQIINYAIYHDSLSEDIDLMKVFPKYDEKWKYSEVSDEDVLTLKNKYNSYSGFRSIVSSMMTNYGRASGMYGDFGRYTFQAALSPWKQRFDIQDLSNIVINRCLELGYSPELFSEYDTLDGRYFDRFSNKEERIGKKYQWIAFYEILAEISDNFIPYQIKDTCKTEKGCQEFWSVNDSYLRDIDVSATDETMPTLIKRIFNFSLPNYLTNEWMKEDVSIEELSYFLSTEIGEQEYYTLSFYNDDKRNNNSKSFSPKTSENYTVMGRAVFFKNSELAELHEEAQKNSGNVSSPGTHKVFLREYYWAESYNEWEKELNDYDEYDKKKYIHASHCYEWEKAKQHTSLVEEAPNESLSLLMPSKILVDFGKLKMNDEYIWKNEQNENICFDGRSIGGERVLLAKKDYIDEFCLKNNYSIAWFCYYDKIGLSQYHDSHYYFIQEGNEYTYFVQDNEHGKYNH